MPGQPSSAHVSEGVDLLLGWLWPRVEGMARIASREICAQVEDYRSCDEPGLAAEVEAHSRQVFVTFLACAAEGRDPSPDDFAWTARHALHRVDLGIGLPAFLQGFRVGQIGLWDAILLSVEEHPGTQEAALMLAGQLMRVIEIGSTVAAEAYVEAQQFTVADEARVTRDLLDDLLEGKPPTMRRRQEMLADVGLAEESPLLVAVGSFAVAGDEAGARRAAQVLRTALTNPGRGLAAVRHDEVVVVQPVDAGEEERVLARLRGALARLAGQGIFPCVGVSGVQGGLSEVPAAYEEACLARRALRGRTGLQSLSRMSTLDYLVQTHDRTARRLVRPEVRDFVAEDLAAGGPYIATLRQYVACDLNAKLAAAQLHVHANTVYYRLERIAERTGVDVRRVQALIDLLVAVSIVTGSSD